MKPKLRLKITKEEGEIVILGNRAGLEYLSGVCRQIIGKTDPSGHIHIRPEMGNASQGSEPARIEYWDDEDGD